MTTQEPEFMFVSKKVSDPFVIPSRTPTVLRSCNVIFIGVTLFLFNLVGYLDHKSLLDWCRSSPPVPVTDRLKYINKGHIRL